MVNSFTHLMYMNPRALMYGESVWFNMAFTCFLVSLRVNSLNRRQ